jgi:hypothetical protein
MSDVFGEAWKKVKPGDISEIIVIVKMRHLFFQKTAGKKDEKNNNSFIHA